MKISNYKITNAKLDALVSYLKARMTFDYENHSEEMVVLMSEKFYFRNNSKQINQVIVKKVEKNLLVDVMAGAGGSFLLNINWLSEKGYIRRVLEIVNSFAEESSVKVEEINKD
ncbi:MAG: hypothetical protein MI922_08460 [Bacteroidales bacterium]|nr:hypothetical protein [Bacteroidales bacterium]